MDTIQSSRKVMVLDFEEPTPTFLFIIIIEFFPTSTFFWGVWFEKQSIGIVLSGKTLGYTHIVDRSKHSSKSSPAEERSLLILLQDIVVLTWT